MDVKKFHDAPQIIWLARRFAYKINMVWTADDENEWLAFSKK